VHPAAAFRSNADLPDFTGTARVRWNRPVVLFRVADAASPPASVSNTRNDFTDALAAWSFSACGVPVLGLAADGNGPAQPGDGQNTLQWVSDDWSQDVAMPAYTDVQFERS
jgi:hypothetical protein